MAVHYFPFSQEFNSDPEGWEFTDKFGDRALRTWNEILGILDREKNVWKRVEGWDTVLARKVRQSAAKVRSEVGWMVAKHWLIVGQYAANGSPEVLQAPNYSKYRRTHGETNPSPLLSSPTNQPTLRDSDKNQNPTSASPTPSVGLKTSDKKTREEKLMASMNLIPELKKETDRLYGSDPKKFKRLASWVAQGRKHEHLETDMAEALRQFWDYRAIDDWYPYLDSILVKVEADRNRDASLVDHERHKAEVREAAEMFRVK